MHANERRLLAAIDAAAIGVWEWDLRTWQITWLGPHNRLLGFTPEGSDASIGEFIQCIHPDDLEELGRAHQRAWEQGEYAHEYRVLWPDGSLHWIADRGSFLYDDSGERIRMCGAMLDITSRKEAEEALRESELDLAEAQRLAHLGSWSFDVAAGAVRWSDELYRIFDLQKGDPPVTYDTFLARVHPDDRARVVQVNADARATGEPFEIEYRIVTRGGQTRHVREVGYVRKDRAGEVIRLFGTAQDVTERKNAEDLLRTYPRQLIDAQEAERERISRELHDEIGQALTAIKLNLRRVQSAPDTASLALHVEDGIDIVDLTLRRVRDLAFDLRPSLLDDLGLIAALRSYVGREAQRAGLVAELVVDPDDLRVPEDLETSCFRIAQAALTNVVQHAQARRVRVELKQRGTELHLVIRDNGIGFDPRAVEEGRAREVHQGLQGMRERSRLLGGQLEAQSAPGRGTSIHACFPLPPLPSCGPAEGDGAAPAEDG